MLTINGKVYEYEEIALSDWLIRHSIDPELTAVEYNGSIVLREAYPSITFKDGDKLEIMRFVGGG